jgi:hypothetical protein
MGETTGADPHAPIQSDIGGRVDVRTLVGQGLDLSLRPIVPVINEDHLQGAAWAGPVPSQAVFAARVRYYQAQRASLHNLARYLNAAEALIDTIHRFIAAHREPG